MKTIHTTPETTIAYYYPLLQRFAQRLIQNVAASEILAKMVLDDQYKLDGLVPSKNLRQVLKTDLLNRCHYWRQSIVFDRPLVKVPDCDFFEMNNKKNRSVK